MPATNQTTRYQIRPRDDGRFAVMMFAPGSIEPVLRAVADTRQSAKDYIAIELAKQRAA